MHGHNAIITKPSTHNVITEYTISSRGVVLIPGLLPIFLHGCEIKSGSGLGTRLVITDALHALYEEVPYQVSDYNRPHNFAALHEEVPYQVSD